MCSSSTAARPAMLSIQQPKKPNAVIPNVLPCAVAHTGPVDINTRLWRPESDTTGKYSKAYFRGRKLCSRQMKIPDGFIGHNSGGGKKGISQNNLKIGGTPEEEEDEVAESIEGEATFNSIVVWDHEMQPQGKDQFFRGIEEWLAFAEKLHNVDAPIPNAR